MSTKRFESLEEHYQRRRHTLGMSPAAPPAALGETTCSRAQTKGRIVFRRVRERLEHAIGWTRKVMSERRHVLMNILLLALDLFALYLLLRPL